MLKNAVYENSFNVMVCTDDSIQESDIFIRIGDVLIVLHADYSDAVLEIIHQSLVLVDKNDASFSVFYGLVCKFDHSLSLACSFVSY